MFSTWPSAVLAIVTGTLMYTSEVQHGALAAAITAPTRSLLFGAYTVAALAIGTVLLYRRDTN